MSVSLIDEAWAKVDPAQAKTLGYAGVIGYVSQDTTGKNLTRAQVDAIHAAGLDVGLVYEYNPRSALGGYAAGVRDATIAVAHARGLGAPAGVCLYAAVDWDVSNTQMPNVLEYLRGYDEIVRGAGYRSGMYAGYWPCIWARQSDYQGLLWQTYAWSGGQWLDGVAIRQVANGTFVAGADVDRDIAETTDWGQWPPDGGSTMSVTDDRIEALFLGELSPNNTVHRILREIRDGLDPNPQPGEQASWYGLPQVKADLVALQSQMVALMARVEDVSNGLGHLAQGASTLSPEDRQAIADLRAVLETVAAHVK